MRAYKNHFIASLFVLAIAVASIFGMRGTIEKSSAATCGYRIVEVGETCDDGNTSNGDGCSSACAVEADCRCAAGNPSLCVCCDAGLCACGDRIRTALEECDDGNVANGDGCSSTCTVEDDFDCTTVQSGSGEVVCTATGGGNCGDFIINFGDECEPAEFGDHSIPYCQSNGSNICTIQTGYDCFTGSGLSLSYCFSTGSTTYCDWSNITFTGGG